MKINIDDVEGIVMAGVRMDDYPDFCDAYPESAIWKSTGADLTSKELDALFHQYPDEMLEAAHESAHP